MLIALCFTVVPAHVQAEVTEREVVHYFTTIVPKPDNYHHLWFWCGANEGVGNSPEEDAIIHNYPLKRGITPLQIAALIKSENWLRFLLESGHYPFTRIVALREKIEQACREKIIPELNQADKLHLNQPLNVQGQTALELATQAEHLDLIEALKEIYTDMNDKGYTQALEILKAKISTEELEEWCEESE